MAGEEGQETDEKCRDNFSWRQHGGLCRVLAMGMVRSENDRMDTGKELPGVSGSQLRSVP